MRVGVWIAASVGLLWPSVALAEGTLTFFAQSEVIGEEVTVEDVARLEGADAALRERVRVIPLGRSPQPMGAVTLSRPVIELALRHAGVWEELRLVFPREIRVARPGQRLSGQAATAQAQEAAQRYLTEAAPAGYEARVRGLSPLQELLLPKGEVTMKAVGREGASLQGAALLTISVQVEGQPVMTRQVSAQVELTGPVCRLARDIARGELVGEGDVEELRQVAPPGSLPCGEVVGMSARSLLRGGSLAHRSGLQAPVLVRRGDSVSIVYQSGALRVTAQGEAVVDGVKGAQVPVKNSSSGKTIKAVVVGPGQVQVR